MSEPSRRLLLAGNWKMNHSHLEAIQVIRKLSLRVEESAAASQIDVSVHPSFVALRSVQTILESEESRIVLGAQDCHFEDSGAFTGEVSPVMLAKLNVSFVIVGHSERRALFGETDDVVRRKLEAVLRHGMSPIACVGESLELRESGEAEGWVGRQLSALVEGLAEASVRRTVLAYEPIWAIGTGRTPTADEAGSMCGFIRSVVAKHVGEALAGEVRILYGGSVSPGNAGELSAHPEVDGLLVGGASLDPDTYAQVISEAARNAH